VLAALLLGVCSLGSAHAAQGEAKGEAKGVYGFILSKIADRDLADDIFQDTFIKVIHTLKSDRYNEEGKFLPWVVRIAHNLVMDYFRKEKRIGMKRDSEELPFFSFLKDEGDTVESFMVKEQIEEDIRFLIKELPEDQQQVIMMRMYQDLSFKEIAEITDVSINTALGRMRYALLNLRKLIDQKKIILSES
jgi:RNA polymerase sigma-70 factor (ECF subfamily)